MSHKNRMSKKLRAATLGQARRMMMRKLLLALVLTSGLIATAFAETGDLPLMTALFVDADTVQRIPGIARAAAQDGARGELNLSGNVVLNVNGVRITADTAVIRF